MDQSFDTNHPSWTQIQGFVFLRPSATPWPFESQSIADMRELRVAQLHNQADMARAQAVGGLLPVWRHGHNEDFATEDSQLPNHTDVGPEPDAPPEIVISEEVDEETHARNERDYLISSILDLVSRPSGPTPTGRREDSPTPPKKTGVSSHLQYIFTQCYEKSTEIHTCSVCMGVIQHSSDEEDVKISVGKCGHTFHRGCVQRWFSSDHGRGGTCPECRSEY